jgi:hypothetical protein
VDLNSATIWRYLGKYCWKVTEPGETKTIKPGPGTKPYTSQFQLSLNSDAKFINEDQSQFLCFTVHFNSLRVMVQLMHLFVIKH